jgi:hypothetical protein
MHNSNYSIRVRHPLNFERLGELRDYNSISYVRSWQAPGTFQLDVSAESPQIPILIQPNAIIEIVRDGVQEFIGRCLDLRGEYDAGGARYTILGMDMSADIRSKVTLPAPDITNDMSALAGADYDVQGGVSGASAIRHYFNVNCIAPAELNRVMSYMTLGNVYKPSPYYNPSRAPLPPEVLAVDDPLLVTISYKGRFQQLLTVFQDIAVAGNIGWDWRLDGDLGKIYLDIRLAADRRKNNTTGYTPVILSDRNKSLRSMIYTRQGSDIQNVVYLGSSGVGASRNISINLRIVTINGIDYQAGTAVLDWTNPNSMGGAAIIPASVRQWGRLETFMDGSQTATVTDTQIARLLEEHSMKQTIQAQPIEREGSYYRKDYDLGDVITIHSDALRVEGDAVISQIAVNLTPDRGDEVTITLGDKPTSPWYRIQELDRSTLPARTV